MIFFLIWSLYLLFSGKWKLAAIVFACSISIKLIPLLFLPLFWQWFTKRNVIARETKQSVSIKEITTSQAPRNDKDASNLPNTTKLIVFYLIVGVTTILLFLPFYSSQFITNYTETVGLWFNSFEFNGSLYYVAREIGYLFRGYNEIAIIGKFTALIVFLFVVVMALLRNNSSMIQLITAMLFALSVYYFTATTVHPWYVTTLLVLSVFTKYKFPLVWSFVIILSYLAYLQIGNADKSENLWIIVLEYTVVYGFLIWELFTKKQPLFIKRF